MTDHESLDLSVVIGFKDWGQERLICSIHTTIAAMEGVRGEVIVSDYGSTDSEGLRERVEAAGGRYVYTETDGVWSRSRALNAGFESARGKVLVSTDADMAFSPGSLALVCNLVIDDPSRVVIMQCRDLPPAYSAEAFAPGLVIDWSELDRVGRLRPRWGMGGMTAVSREVYALLRGFDERMVIYGGEDMDFVDRVRRAGLRVQWLDDPRARMFHIWHEPSRAIADNTPEGREAVAANRKIYLEDGSFVRNAIRWRAPIAGAAPPVTVVIATHNRAEFLRESIDSVLAQTVQDFDLLVVDDGSDDGTADVVGSVDDPRLRYERRDNGGVAAARQWAAENTRSAYTVIHDDDDLMLPWRLEAHLAALTGGMAGTYGGWVDFSDVTGEMTANDGRTASMGSILYSGKVYAHGTLMLRTDLLRDVGYDRSLRSGSDYNLAVRLQRLGICLAHTGEYHIMRRLHEHQMTALDPIVQKTSAALTTFMAQSALATGEAGSMRATAKAVPPVTVRGASDLPLVCSPYLPDHLVRRSGLVRVAGERGLPDAARAVLSRASATTVGFGPGTGAFRVYDVDDVTWPELATLRSAGLDIDVHLADSPVLAELRRSAGLGTSLRELLDLTPSGDDRCVIVAQSVLDQFGLVDPTAELQSILEDGPEDVLGVRVVPSDGVTHRLWALETDSHPPAVFERMDQAARYDGARSVTMTTDQAVDDALADLVSWLEGGAS